MFFSYGGFLLFIFSKSFLGLQALVELSKVDFDVLITTEDIIRNITNNILSSLLLEKSVNSTRVREFSIIHQYFLSVTFQDSDNLKEISRLSRADYKKFNNSTKNLTTLINEVLNDDECDIKANETEEHGNDAYISQHVDSFLAKLEALKESYGVNKVLTDINSNIIKILEESSRLSARGNEFRNFTEYNDTDADDAFLQDSNEFWIPSGRRIYKGQRSKIKYYPFMASIHIFNTFQCAGSIIKSDLIITASSCLQLAWNNRFYRENPAFLSVRVGSSFYNGGGESISVLEIYFHPDYHPKNLWNNICVLRLVRHIRFLKKTRKSVKKIAIDTNPWNLPTNTPGITIVGWGAKGRSNTLADPWVNIISFAVLDVYPLRECQEVYSKQYVTKNNFCGGFFAKGSGACNRDVGAPGIVDGTLVGVVSFGSPVCGTPDAPTVFTKLGYYYSWIQTIMKLKVPHSKKRATPGDMFDPLVPYRTTRITTTTFRIEPLEEGEKPPSIPSETDLEDALRTLDDKLFHEFLETMFGSTELKKYDSLLNRDIVLRDKNNVDNIQQENQITEGYATESSKVTDHNDNTELYIPLTQGFELADVPRTQLMLVDNDPITEKYSHVIEDISEDHDAYHKIYKSVQYTTKIKRKHKLKNPNQFMSTTAIPQREIFLELATESSADSDQSVALQSGIKLVLSKEVNEKYSSDASDIPGEQVISELLDEIDLNEILREGTTASTIVSKPYQSYKKKHLSKKGHIWTSTPVATNKYNTVRTKLPDHKSVGSIDKTDKNSVLTLLYLSDDEKKQNVNPYIGNVVKIEDKFTAANDGADCKDCSKIYNIVPKSELYKIISRVLKVAIGNKD